MKTILKKKILLMLCIMLAFSGINISSGDNIQVKAEAVPTDVLFVGNSMTYYNTLCDVVEGIASRKGHVLNCTEVTVGGTNLIYHSKAEATLNAIKKGGYEVVVLQDVVGSFDGEELMEGANAIVPIIKQYNPGVKIVFYEPWPTKPTLTGEYNLLSYFTENYVKAAKNHEALLAPAGETFYDVYVNSGLDYYCLDGKHPQPLGTFVSASTIYYTIFDEEHVDFPDSQHSYLNELINSNVAHTNEGVQNSYDLKTLNLIMERGHYYANAVKDGESVNSEYVSVAGKYKDPDAGQNPDNLPSVTGKKVDDSFFAKKKGNMASGCKVYASYEKQKASNATDGNLSTRWESESADPQWLYVDLGSPKTIKTVGFAWEGAYASKYYIQISDDAKTWKTVAVVTASSKKTERITLSNTYTTRYVQMFGTKRGTKYGYSFYEMGVWGPEETFVTVKNTAIKKAYKKKTAKKAKVVLKKVKGATRYQVKISTSKKFKKYKIKTYKKNSFTIKKLKKNKKYYIKARAYKKVNGKIYYGKWTKRKAIKFK